MSQTNRKLVSGGLATSSVLVAAAVMIAANLAASQLDWRLDMTENQVYTLNDASRDAVTALEEDVVVKVFVSPDMPAPMHTLGESIADTLSEYRAASGGRLTFEIIEPSDEDSVEEDAKGYGCQKVAIGQQSEDEVSLRAVYKCVAFIKGDKQQVITDLNASGIPGQDNLEYEFTKALLNLADVESRKVGFVAGFGGPADSPQFAEGAKGAFTQLYGELLSPMSVDLSAEATVPSDVVALILVNPDKEFTDSALFALDQFLQRGGAVGWFQSSTTLDLEIRDQLLKQMGNQMGQLPEIRKPVDPRLNGLFATYGIRHNQDLVLDRANGLTFGMVMTENGPASVSHPATFQITDIDRSIPFMAGAPPMALPAPASLSLDPGLQGRDDLSVYEILTSADTAVRRERPPSSFNDFDGFMNPTTDETPGAYVLAAAIEGDVPSYFDLNPLPEGRKEEDLVRDPALARILVIGSGEFFSPLPAVGYDERLASVGQQLLFGSIEWLAQDQALSKIRAKSLPRFVGEVSKQRQREIQIINVVVVPLAFVVIAVFMFGHRRRRRERISL